MPIYDYECSCGKRKNDEFVHRRGNPVKCDCGKTMKRKFPCNVHMHLFPVGGIHLENVGPEGKTFYSYGEMRRFAKENNMELGALL